MKMKLKKGEDITLRMTEDEARVLFRLCGNHVVGPRDTWRGTSDAVYYTLLPHFGTGACARLPLSAVSSSSLVAAHE